MLRRVTNRDDSSGWLNLITRQLYGATSCHTTSSAATSTAPDTHMPPSTPTITEGGNGEPSSVALAPTAHAPSSVSSSSLNRRSRTGAIVVTQTQHFEGDIAKLSTHLQPDGVTPKGRNASGRSWKVRPQKRASSLVTKVPLNGRSKAWERKQGERRQRKEAAEAEREMREERRKEILEKRERRLENERRRAENEFNVASRSAKNLNLQTVGVKMGAMSKKQLRQIKKTRMNAKTGVVEYVPAYAK